MKRRQIQTKIIAEEDRLEKEASQIVDEKQEMSVGGEADMNDDKSQAAMSNKSQIKSKHSGRAGEASTLTTTSALLPESVVRCNIEDDFKGVLLNLWKQLSGNFNSQMKCVLGKQKMQREGIQQYLHQIQTHFLVFLQRRDTKQHVLDKFVTDLNSFSNTNPDMREDD